MSDSTTLSFAVLSGKGGVGKSNIALNLAYALEREQPSLLVDCDLGLASLDVLLGMQTGETLEDLLHSDKEAAGISVPLPDGGPRFIPAASGNYALGQSDDVLRSLFKDKLLPFAENFSYLVMDIGAGISGPVQVFATMPTLRIVVVTPEPTSLTDAYALMKVLSTNHGTRDFFILVNQVASKAEEDLAFARISGACERFLGFTPLRLGGIRLDPAVPEAVRRQKPLLTAAPDSDAAKDFLTLASRLHRLRDAMQPRLAGSSALRL